jgi:TrmH family RNA methyltransferase
MITSTSNPTIKGFKKLREKKARLESGLFYIEGLRIVTEACQQSAPIDTIIYSPELLVSDWGRQLVKDQTRLGTNLLEVNQTVFEYLSLKEGPQGIAAIVHQSIMPISELKIDEGELYIALDSVQDPGNLGTILRTSDAVGARGVILLDQSTDPYDPTATRASMGAIFNQAIYKADIDQFSAWLKPSNVPVIGTSDSAKQDYHQFQFPSPMILLMGSEKQGLKEEHYRLCNAVVRIPMHGTSDSLNLAVATGIVLYEINNQQRDGKAPSGVG